MDSLHDLFFANIDLIYWCPKLNSADSCQEKIKYTSNSDFLLQNHNLDRFEYFSQYKI